MSNTGEVPRLPSEISASLERNRVFVSGLETALGLADEVHPLKYQQERKLKRIGLDFLLGPNPAGRGIVRVRFYQDRADVSKYEGLIAGGVAIDVMTSGHEMVRQRIEVGSHPNMKDEYVLSFSDVRFGGEDKAGISHHFIDPRERIEAASLAFGTGILADRISSSLNAAFPSRPLQVFDGLFGFFRLNLSERAFLNHLANTNIPLQRQVGQFEIKIGTKNYHVDPARIAGDLKEIQDRVRALAKQGDDMYFQAVLRELVRTFDLQELRGKALLRHPWVQFMREELGPLCMVEQLEAYLENFPTMTLVHLREEITREGIKLDKTRDLMTTVRAIMGSTALLNELPAVFAQDLSHFTEPELTTETIRIFTGSVAVLTWLYSLYSNKHRQRNEYRRSQALRQLNHAIINKDEE